MRSFLKKNSKIVEFLHVCTELILGFFSYLLMARVAGAGFVKPSPLFYFFLLLWVVFAYRNKLYTSFRTASIAWELKGVYQSFLLALAFTVLISYVVPGVEHLVMRNVIVCAAVFLASLTVFRIFLRLVLSSLRRHGYNYREILLIGSNERSLAIIEELRTHPSYGYRLLGIVDNLERAEYWNSISTLPFLGDLASLKRILSTRAVDGIYVTLPIKSFYREISEVIRICSEIGMPVYVGEPFRNTRPDMKSGTTLAGIHFLNYSTVRTSGWQFMVKRLIDIFVSILILIFTGPMLLFIMLLIKLTSRGPALFLQTRIGKNSRPFKLIKLRTMVADAEKLKPQLAELNEMDGPVFKIRHDPRVTTIGRFLRKFSIDEIPQLINVLKGEMSLVGPRPGLKEEVEAYMWGHRKRLSVIPGITGLWQIMGRNNISFDEWMKLDIYYVEHWSLKLDLYIILKTIPVVLSTRGAS